MKRQKVGDTVHSSHHYIKENEQDIGTKENRKGGEKMGEMRAQK